jgi:hypothetical protein
MEDNETAFWLRLWTAIIIGIISFVGIIALYCANTNWRIAEAVAQGVDPIAARCAYTVLGHGEVAMCTAIAISKK